MQMLVAREFSQIDPSFSFQMFYWNIDANVGLRSPNHPEDVQLVQFGFFAASQVSEEPPELIRLYAAVRPGAIYTGAQNDPLSLAILGVQRFWRRGPQDGHVSVIRANTYYSRDNYYFLCELGSLINKLMPSDYPRIDKHPNCPPLVRTRIRRFFE